MWLGFIIIIIPFKHKTFSTPVPSPLERGWGEVFRSVPTINGTLYFCNK
jgi:hypothetical protein